MDIWENERWSWPIGRKATTDNPVPGDRIVFFYAPSGGDEPGFYGWAIVLDTYEDERGIYFRPVVPSDHLKMDPWWDDKAKAAADEIRGKVKQGTLWQVPDDLAVAISSGITSWLSRPADESRLNAMIAQHQKLRLRFREEDRHELDRLTVLMRKQLFAALPRVNLLASATQMVRKIIPGVTAAEARSLSEYVLGGIASGRVQPNRSAERHKGDAGDTNELQFAISATPVADAT
jgi:hypothetical protein